MNITFGTPYPLGASVTDQGINFAIASDVASYIEICLFDDDGSMTPVMLPAKTGTIWHGCIEKLEAGQHYSVRAGQTDKDTFDTPLLIDPYAKLLEGPIHFDAKLHNESNRFSVPKAIVTASTSKPRTAKPKINHSERIIYEAHVKGLSQCHPSVDSNHRGTYLGASHPDIVAHIKSLGVTTVQFMPVFAFMPEPYITNKGMTNYWGYNPVSYMAPEPRYAKDNALTEIKTMIDTYHEAGIEVIIDVVFNHTAEGSDDGIDLCLRGLFGKEVYLHTQDKAGQSYYANYSGCGNTVNTAHPFMFGYILDALRYWVDDIGADGFRFDLAPGLGREPHEFNHLSGLMKAILQDPSLKHTVLIAEPWDMGPNGYQLGAFPYPWLEVNDRYRDSLRAFWRGDHGLVGELATRLMGSRDIFSKAHRPNYSSVNCISYHDGFTLHDLVTYNDKHNVDNGEDNRDGHNHNLSNNYGVEGETDNLSIVKLREKQKRNVFASLLLSQGTPHFVAGDELSRTQKGNNNAYCQDNEISWLDWSMTSKKENFLAFCQKIISLRQESALLGDIHLLDDTFHHSNNIEAIKWYKADGAEKATKDWQQNDSNGFAIEIIGSNIDGEIQQKRERWLLCINGGQSDLRFTLPKEAFKSGWRLRLDTRHDRLESTPDICIRYAFLQEARSLTLFSFEQALTNPN